MKTYLTRHSETPLNQLRKVNGEIDEPLNETGIAQAKELAASLPPSLKIIYSSPLKRAIETATYLSEKTNLPINITSALTEVRMGNLAGKSWKEMPNGQILKKLHRSVQYDYLATGGENVADVFARLKPFLSAISHQFNDHEVLFITHGGIIRTLKFLETGEIINKTQDHAQILELDLDKILKSINQLNKVRP